MSADRDLAQLRWRRRLIDALDERLVNMVRRPALYGPDIAVELQALQLLAVRAAALRDDPRPLSDFRPGDALVAFNRRHFPGAPPITLADLLAERGESHRFGELLGDFCREVIHGLECGDVHRFNAELIALTDLGQRALAHPVQEEELCI